MLDPPYIHSPGKHETDARYQNAAFVLKGMLWKNQRKQLYIPGMKEAMRIVKEDGRQVWVKCKGQVQSGMQRRCHVELCHDAVALGLYPRDMFILMANARTADTRWSVQRDARMPHSFLWIFQRPERKSTSANQTRTPRHTRTMISTYPKSIQGVPYRWLTRPLTTSSVGGRTYKAGGKVAILQ